MSQIAYADPTAAPPELGRLGIPKTGADEAAGLRASLAAAVPAIIAVTVHWVFFIAYWIPETSTFPAHQWWLTQLSPMVSASLTSAGHPQVPAQETQSGVPGLVFGLSGLALWWMSRTRYWLGRTALVVPTAIGLLAALVSVGALLVTGTFGSSTLSVVLMIIWVTTAGYATFHGFRTETPDLGRKTWRRGLPLLVAYALVGPAPTAVGRCLFAPDLRDVAAGLQANTVALRLAALWTPATVLLYLSGLLVGVTVWVAYQWWPPRQRLSFVGLSLVLAGTVFATGGLGWPANTAAERRVTTLFYASPAGDVHFTCGSRVLDQPDLGADPQPALTLVVTGFTCHSVTAFSGYRQLATRTLPGSLSPVQASTPEGRRISGRIVAAQYGAVLVVATSDRASGRANQLTAVRTSDLTELWTYACADRRELAVRFAAVPGGDRPALGHLTVRERSPQVVARCDGRTVGFDPARGPRR